MNEQCPICSYEFDHELNPPLVVCQKQHLSCSICHYLVMKQKLVGTCSQCRQLVFNNQVTAFQPYQCSDQYLLSVKAEHAKQLYSAKKEMISTIGELIGFDQSNQQHIYHLIKQTVKILMRTDDYQTAGLLLRKLIEASTTRVEEEELIGLGMVLEQEGYCQNKGYNWYQEIYGNNISTYDLLNLCHLKFEFDYSQTKNWCITMSHKYPHSYRILYCLALIVFNTKINYQQAVQVFDKITAINKEFSKPYLGKAYSYRVLDQKEKVMFNLSQMQRREPDNKIIMYWMHYFIGMSAQQICFDMQNLLQVEPNYAMALLKVGQYKQDPQQRINIYEQCIRMNDMSISAHMSLGYQKCLKRDQTALHCFINALKLRWTWPQQDAICYGSIGRFYAGCQQYDLAIKFYDKVSPLIGQQYHQYSYFQVQAYFKSGYYDKAIQKGKTCLGPMKYAFLYIPSFQKEKLSALYYCMVSIYFQRKDYFATILLLKQWQAFFSKSNDLYLNFINFKNKYFSLDYHQKDCYKWYKYCHFQNYQLQSACQSLAQIYQDHQRYEEALYILNESIKKVGLFTVLATYRQQLFSKYVKSLKKRRTQKQKNNIGLYQHEEQQ